MRIFFIFILFTICLHDIQSQVDTIIADNKSSFFIPANDLNRKRIISAGGLGALTYTAFSVGLYNSWYKDYPQSSFHLFNDWGEWENMDKAGHVFSGYFQSILTYKGAKWAGISEKNAIWLGIGCSTLFQSTIEVMDGFSSEWGFSIPDIASNIVGTSTFALQQHFLGEQRIQIKESAWPVNHPKDVFITNEVGIPISLYDRAKNLYGSSLGERLLKDYNAQTYWASINIRSFIKDSKWPHWLNIALGYSAENMYGGFENRWIADDLTQYDARHIARYHQFLIAFDLDLNKINTKNTFLKTLFSIGNIFKIPSPTLEITSRGEFIFHFIYF